MCNVEMSDEFGLWMTEHGTASVHIPLPLQLIYDMTHADPFVPFDMQDFNVGVLICEGLKSLIESYITDNRSVCSCTDIERLLLIVEELEVTYLPIDSNGDVNRSGTPLVPTRHSDLRQLFKTHVMRSAMAQIKRPSDGPITFQPAFICTFKINVSKVAPFWPVTSGHGPFLVSH
jgi:hypothetical protein